LSTSINHTRQKHHSNKNSRSLSLFLRIAAAPGVFLLSIEAVTTSAPQPHLSSAAVAEPASAPPSSVQRPIFNQEQHLAEVPIASRR